MARATVRRTYGASLEVEFLARELGAGDFPGLETAYGGKDVIRHSTRAGVGLGLRDRGALEVSASEDEGASESVACILGG